MSGDPDDTLDRSAFARRDGVSGPVPRAAREGDARAERLAEFLGRGLGRDVEAVDELLERLGDVERGRPAEVSVGVDGIELHVDATGARIHDDVVDLDLGDNPDGVAYACAELDAALRWWREVLHDWRASSGSAPPDG